MQAEFPEPTVQFGAKEFDAETGGVVPILHTPEAVAADHTLCQSPKASEDIASAVADPAHRVRVNPKP